MITTALLDLDGTLIDSNDQHAKAWVEVLTEFGHPVTYREARAAIGKGSDHLLPDVVGLAADSREGKRITERRGALFKERYLPTLRPFPHARELLERMYESGLRLVVATSAKPEEMHVILELIGVTRLMHDGAAAGDAKRSKPDGDILGAALKKAGCATGEAIMLGDTPYDVEAARRSSVGAVALRCGGWGDEDLRGALAIYDNPTQLLAGFDASPFLRRP
jgi:phosphoglycolate phosphatase-like HAD superfamily hydrolase